MRKSGTIEQANILSTYLGNGYPTKLFIEDTGYQRSIIQELVRQGYNAEGVKLLGQDKKARPILTTCLIKNGNILFPFLSSGVVRTPKTEYFHYFSYKKLAGFIFNKYISNSSGGKYPSEECNLFVLYTSSMKYGIRSTTSSYVSYSQRFIRICFYIS